MRNVARPRWLVLTVALAIIPLLGFGTAHHLAGRLGAQSTLTPTVTRPPAPSPTRTIVPTLTVTATVRPSYTATPSAPTPTASSPAVRTGGITYDMTPLRALQSTADGGGAAYALDPVRVTVHDLPGLGFSAGPIGIVSPAPPSPSPTAHRGEDGLPETDVIVRYRGRQYWI